VVVVVVAASVVVVVVVAVVVVLQIANERYEITFRTKKHIRIVNRSKLTL
jgi:hypothetical protein